jgi:hypothetical protein
MYEIKRNNIRDYSAEKENSTAMGEGDEKIRYFSLSYFAFTKRKKKTKIVLYVLLLLFVGIDGVERGNEVISLSVLTKKNLYKFLFSWLLLLLVLFVNDYINYIESLLKQS